MARTPEGRVKEDVRRYLKSKGVWFYQPVQNGMGVVGIPDFICCWKGRFFAVETKAPGKCKNVTPNQVAVMSAITNNGGYAVVVDNIQHLEDYMTVIEVSEKLTGERDAKINPAEAEVSTRV